MTATLTSKGQITLPKLIRDRLRLHAGDQLEFLLREDGRLEVIPKRGPLRELKAMIPPPRRNVTLADMEKAVAEGARASGRT